MDPLLLLIVAVVIALVIFAVHKVRGNAPPPPPAGNDEAGDPGGPALVTGVGRRARARRTVRRVAEDEDDLETESPVGGNRAVGTKKLKKLQAKADKKAMREQEEALREDEKRRKELREKERKEKEVEDITRQKKEEEQILKLKAEQEEREHQEYLMLKESFIVEDEGICDDTDEQKTLNEFIAFIKSNKVVFLEDLAAEFNMRTQSVIDRIDSLQQSGQLTGVVDDRGKFIFISLEEMRSVAKFIKQRGRVSISELAQSSNSLITLQ